MIVWLLYVVFTTQPGIPLEIFPDSVVGQESCQAAVLEAQDAIKQAVEIACGRF